MLYRILGSISQRTVLILVTLTLMVACATEEPLRTDQPIEPSFQEKVTNCSKIGDRSERDRCLYGG